MIPSRALIVLDASERSRGYGSGERQLESVHR